jgi:hypothetical protein
MAGRMANLVDAFAKPVRCNVRVESEVLAAAAAGFELLSVFEARVQGQESMGVAYREGKSDTP